MQLSEYTTVTDVRSSYLGSTQTQDDGLILSIIREASREIDRITRRKFYPRIETRTYDAPAGVELILDDDLLELTTLTNGDGTAITNANYKLYPLNDTPKYKIVLAPGSAFNTSSTFGDLGAISVAGTWGYHRDYATDGWLDYGAILSAAISNTTATTFTSLYGNFKAGNLVKIDSEYLYISSAVYASTSTYTVKRGVNGSTAAAHLIAAPIYLWGIHDEIERLACQATAAYYRLRSNPGMDSVSIDGVTFVTPRDVTSYMLTRLRLLSGIIREAL